MSWLPALRIARRDALRARGRSLLIAAMVALPVLGIGAADVLFRSQQLDPDERLARELGRAQAELTFAGGGRVVQPPDHHRYGFSLEGRARAGRAPRLPDGYRALTSREGQLRFRTAGGEAPVRVIEVASGDEAFTGRFELLRGRHPTAAWEVAVTAAALERLGAKVGDPARLVDGGRVTVVGVVERTGGEWGETVWARPGSLLPDQPELLSGAAPLQPPSVFLVGERPVTWADVQRLNRLGFAVFSRAVVLDPPPDSQVPYFSRGLAPREVGQAAIATVLALALLVTLAILEVVLLAGAAFAVGARRQARSLGLLSAAGGDARHVRRVVLAGGLVLGCVGALAGLVLAVGLSALAIPLLERHAEADFGRFDLRPLELAGATLIGVVSGLLAAVLPARAAARRDPVEALTGRRGQVRTPRKVSAIGIGLIGLGIAVAALGSLLALSELSGVHPAAGQTALVAAGLIAGGAALTQLGLIVCSPAIVGLAGRWARRLPLALRLALTDAARHRGRSAPAVAAVLAAVTSATALALVAASFEDRDRANYLAAYPPGTAGIELTQSSVAPDGTEDSRRAAPSRVAEIVRPELPAFTLHEIRGPAICTDPDGCAGTALVFPESHPCSAGPGPNAVGGDGCDIAGGYRGGHLPSTPTGGPDLVRLLAGRAPAEATAVLSAGGAVVLDPRYVADGTVTFARTSPDGSQTESLRVPAVALPTRNPPVQAIVAPEVVERLRVSFEPTHVLLSFTEPPTTEEEDAARLALSAAGMERPFAYERGFESDYSLGLLVLVLAAAAITLGAAGIATGLAQADARADHATLAAVGATPRLRRTLAAAQALSVAGLGALLGVLAGLVPGVAFIGAVDSLRLVVPWLTLAQVLVGIPLVAAGFAWVFTRSGVPLERRVAA